jgi:hypothetical protein
MTQTTRLHNPDFNKACPKHFCTKVLLLLLLHYCHHQHHPLIKVSFPLILLLNQWHPPLLKFQFSDCSTFFIVCYVPTTSVLVQWLMLLLHIQEVPVRISAGRPATIRQVSRVFLGPSARMSLVVFQTRARYFLSVLHSHSFNVK